MDVRRPTGFNNGTTAVLSKSNECQFSDGLVVVEVKVDTQ